MGKSSDLLNTTNFGTTLFCKAAASKIFFRFKIKCKFRVIKKSLVYIKFFFINLTSKRNTFVIVRKDLYEYEKNKIG